MVKHGRTKTKKNSLCILIVDDQLEQAKATALSFPSSATTIARTPDEVTEADLQCAHLALIDFVLDEWDADDSRSLAEHPANGVALAAVLRSHLAPDTRTAFALHSGKLDGLSGGLSVDCHLHSIARLNNVEWVFSKKNSDNERPLRDQAVSLAKAMYALPKNWPTKQPKQIQTTVEELLGLGKSDWAAHAWKQVEECHPPIHELSPPTYAITFVRWLLTSILPYSTFLWDYRHLAARLRVSPASLKKGLESDSKLAKKLSPFEYTGILSDFLDRRWWRPGIEHFLWQETKAKPFDVDGLNSVTKKLSAKLESTHFLEPVVAFDEKLRATDELVELSEAVELYPDGWPSYAGRPWAPRSVADHDSQLSSLMAPLAAR